MSLTNTSASLRVKPARSQTMRFRIANWSKSSGVRCLLLQTSAMNSSTTPLTGVIPMFRRNCATSACPSLPTLRRSTELNLSLMQLMKSSWYLPAKTANSLLSRKATLLNWLRTKSSIHSWLIIQWPSCEHASDRWSVRISPCTDKVLNTFMTAGSKSSSRVTLSCLRLCESVMNLCASHTVLTEALWDTLRAKQASGARTKSVTTRYGMSSWRKMLIRS
mmetsp:Transcript_34777/g.99520  ORF Transcript_34777/g.99520 Transcript_34777/m.99520 type:complete len:220 (+) Transcript_34777:334-993(+)